ncbi:MAG: outer membrane beta-barrel protein [Chlorobi bacterium]|nr:outer membrane beta-barrel protein [Chlorobiota bacterium]
MKRFIISLVICLGLLAIVNNDAYSKKKGASAAGGTKIGLGISLNPASLFNSGEMMFLPVSMMNIYLPIQFGNSFRLEPEFGIYRDSEIIKNDLDGDIERIYSFYRIGLGAFKTIKPANNFLMYFGPRIGVLMVSSERNYSNDPDRTSSQNIIIIGGSVGGEYYLSDHFSLGAEVQLNFFSYGDEEETPESQFDSESSQTVITTNGLIFARFYF